jgi:hypothetical protein
LVFLVGLFYDFDCLWCDWFFGSVEVFSYGWCGVGGFVLGVELFIFLWLFLGGLWFVLWLFCFLCVVVGSVEFAFVFDFDHVFWLGGLGIFGGCFLKGLSMVSRSFGW